jgi:hypothetical protein
MLFFYSREFLVSQLIPKLENHPLLGVGYCLFDIFAAIMHIWRPLPPFTNRKHAMLWNVENCMYRVKEKFVLKLSIV